VHLLQSELDTKEKELNKVKERMQEMGREDDISLHAIPEKESLLGQKNENLVLLQKQVRELRTQMAQKEGALRRAATFFDEFIYSMHEAKFNSKKKTPLSLQTAGSTVDQKLKMKSAISNSVTPDAASDEKASKEKESTEVVSKQESKHRHIAALSQSKSHDLVSTLSLDLNAESKLKRLQDILKPYLFENKVDVSFLSLSAFSLFLPSTVLP
jgi:hypothetical protein